MMQTPNLNSNAVGEVIRALNISPALVNVPAPTPCIETHPDIVKPIELFNKTVSVASSTDVLNAIEKKRLRIKKIQLNYYKNASSSADTAVLYVYYNGKATPIMNIRVTPSVLLYGTRDLDLGNSSFICDENTKVYLTMSSNTGVFNVDVNIFGWYE